jgi:hypothetical protein
VVIEPRLPAQQLLVLDMPIFRRCGMNGMNGQGADIMVLARVPKERIRSRDAFEFFQRLDAEGRPVWTKEIAQRGAVFSNPGRCLRSQITYNAALRRYLWWQQVPNVASGDKADTRFHGGFGIYDAAEPWGPWTTSYCTERWAVGPGETGSFPTKWMSADGKTLYLVFSGDDCFSIRKATITLQQANELVDASARRLK